MEPQRGRELQAAADELYGLPPDEFVARRTALAAEVRAAGDRALAKLISQLRRPTRTAWLVNLLARSETARVDELLSLADALRDAQRRMDGAALRTLSRQRRTLVDALSRRAVDLGHEAGYTAPDGALREISTTLQSALADPEAAESLRRGHLSQALSYGGFPEVDLAAQLAASLPASTDLAEPGSPQPDDLSTDQAAAHPESAPETKARQAAQHEIERREAQARLARADAADRARAAAEEAEEGAQAATARADDLADQVESLRARLRDAEEAEREARQEARAARKRLQELRLAAATAQAVASD